VVVVVIMSKSLILWKIVNNMAAIAVVMWSRRSLFKTTIENIGLLWLSLSRINISHILTCVGLVMSRKQFS
jgi:hypothetical protein